MGLPLDDRKTKLLIHSLCDKHQINNTQKCLTSKSSTFFKRLLACQAEFQC